MAKFKDIFVNALLGKPSEDIAPMQIRYDYGDELQGYLDTLPQQAYTKDLFARKDLTTPQINEAIANGLNFGIPEITAKQKELGVNIPQTGAELDLAKIGQFNNYPLVSNIKNSPREGGFLRDIARGYNENLNQGFDVSNLEPDKSKGLATRIGEGLGTLVRFYDKPIGRMATATGLSYLTGEANPLGEGVKAYVGRQKNITADKVYRNQLRQLGMSDEELNDIKGNITKDIYEGVTSGMRLGNQRMTWGQLALLDEDIAKEVALNPELANQFVPVNFARDVFGKKRDVAEGKMAETNAKTKKLEKEAENVGKPKTTISIRKGGTTSVIQHVGSGGKNGRPTKKVNYKTRYGLE